MTRAIILFAVLGFIVLVVLGFAALEIVAIRISRWYQKRRHEKEN